jgi:hypothetical protein
MIQRRDSGSTAHGSPAPVSSRRVFLAGTAGGVVLALTGAAGAERLFSRGGSGTPVTAALRGLTGSSAQGAVVASSSVAAQTFTATAPSGVSAGDLLVAVCYDSQGTSQSFTAASGWSAPSANASGFKASAGNIYVFYTYATGSDSYAFSGSGIVTDVSIAVLRVTGGPASGDPFDAIGYEGIASGTAVTMPGAAVIAGYANDLAICAYGGKNGQTVSTGPSGMTAGASGAAGTSVSLYTYWQSLSAYGVIGNRPVTWSAAHAMLSCTILVKAASPAAPGGVVYTQRSNSTLLGGEAHYIPDATSVTKSLTTVAVGDLVIMFIHWSGSGIAVASVSSSHVSWASSAAVITPGSSRYGEIWYGTVTSAATATVLVSFTGTNSYGTELGFDEWGASTAGTWSVEATGTVSSGSSKNQDITSAQVTATGNGLFWSYTLCDDAGSYGLSGDYEYYFTRDASNGCPISWRYDLSAATAYQASAWTAGGTGRWNGGGVVFQAGGTVPGVLAVASSSVVTQTFTANAPSGVNSGDLLVAVCYDAEGASQTFTAPSGWSAPNANPQDFVAGAGTVYVFCTYATGSDSYAFSGSGSASDVAIGVLRVTGGPSSGDPFDAIGFLGIASGAAAATMPGAAAIASKSNDLAICMYGGSSGQSVSKGPSGMTAGASGAVSPNVSMYLYWQTLSNQYGIIGNRPVTWAAADPEMTCTILIPAASPAAPGGTVYTQRSNSTLLGGETYSTPGAASMTQSLATVAVGDLVIMFIHWTGGGSLAVSSVSSSHVTWASSAAVISTGSATTFHEEIWYGTVMAATTATVTVSFNAVSNQGTELGFDSWGASPSGAWSVQAAGIVDSGSTTNQDVTLAQVTATGNGLYWAYDTTDDVADYGLSGDYGYYFTQDASNGSPVSWRYDLSAATAYQASAWTAGGTGRWNGGGVAFQASGTVSGVVAVASSSVVTQTFTATAPSGVNSGDLLIAVCYDAQGASQTFTAPSGWSAPTANPSNFNANYGTTYVFYKYATGSDSYAFSGSGSASDVAIGVMRVIGGAASGNPFDAIGYWGIASGESAATMPGAVAIASETNDLAICVYGGYSAQAITTGPAGMTAGASGNSGGHSSLYTYWETLSGQYGLIGNRPVTWSTAKGVANCTLLVKAATPTPPSGTVYTQRSNSTLLGGETHTFLDATSTTQTLTTVAVGDLVIMFIHWAGAGIAVASVASSNVTWAASAAVTTVGSQTGYHGEIWYGTVTSAATATVTVTFSGKNTYGTELGFDEWGASAGSTWSVQATGIIDSGSTKDQAVTSAQVTASGNGLLWTYDITDVAGFFGLTGDYGYYFTDDAYNGSPISWRYDLSVASYQSSAWTEGGAAPGRWNGAGVVFQKT